MNLGSLEEFIKDSYSIEKSPEKLKEWVDLILCDIVKKMKFNGEVSYEEFRRSQWLKKVREEASVFANAGLDKMGISQVRMFSGNQNYDAILTFSDNTQVYAECTCAKDGQLEEYQFKHLEMFGRSPASGVSMQTLFEAGKLGKEVFPEAVSINEVLAEAIKLIKSVIDRKMKNEYPEGCWLFISCDDGGLDEDEHWEKLCAMVDTSETKSKFSEVVLVGIVSKRSKFLSS